MQKHVEMIIDYITDGTDFQYNDNHGLLIRCKDCRWSIDSQLEDGKLYCELNNEIVEDRGYCSFAERRN